MKEFFAISGAHFNISAVDKALDGAVTQLVKQGVIKGNLNEITLLHSLGKLPAGRVAITGLGKKQELTVDKVRGAVAETCRYLKKNGAASIATILQGAGVNKISRDSAAQAIAEGARLGLYTFRRYITKKDKDTGEIKNIQIVGTEREKRALEKAVDKGTIIAEAVNWARDIVNEPANNMTPSQMADAARKLADTYGLSIEVLEKERMTKLGMGGLLGCQHLRYELIPLLLKQHG